MAQTSRLPDITRIVADNGGDIERLVRDWLDDGVSYRQVAEMLNAGYVIEPPVSAASVRRWAIGWGIVGEDDGE